MQSQKILTVTKAEYDAIPELSRTDLNLSSFMPGDLVRITESSWFHAPELANNIYVVQEVVDALVLAGYAQYRDVLVRIDDAELNYDRAMSIL